MYFPIFEILKIAIKGVFLKNLPPSLQNIEKRNSMSFS